jgi:hypothetical protein
MDVVRTGFSSSFHGKGFFYYLINFLSGQFAGINILNNIYTEEQFLTSAPPLCVYSMYSMKGENKIPILDVTR